MIFPGGEYGRMTSFRNDRRDDGFKMFGWRCL